MGKRTERLTVDELRSVYEERCNVIRARLSEFKKVAPSEYFYELAYCLLTPQSSAVNAARAVHLLRQQDFLNSDLDPEPLLHQKDFYIRFHKTKARHLLSAKAQIASITHHLSIPLLAPDLRQWLVDNVMGLGWKEASHFLRNIGLENLAILDRHILRNLLRIRVLRSMPNTLTRKRYLAIERKFFKFAQQIGIPMDELDLLFWSLETGEILK